MKFEEYIRNWLERQKFTKAIYKTTRQSVDYICEAIGSLEPGDIQEADIDRIFLNERLFNRTADFLERTFRVLNSVISELIESGIIDTDPALHIYSPVIFSHEKLILDKLDVELTEKSPFVDVSCMWLKNQNYKPVTYNLYYHFLSAYIHPFIGKKSIGLIDQNNIRRIYMYFNTVNPNDTWVNQIHLVMRKVFQYAIANGLIVTNPLMNIDDPWLKPIKNLDDRQKNAVRAAFNKYGFRKLKRKELSKELYNILCAEETYTNRNGMRKNSITLGEVFQQWYKNTQKGVLSDATADTSFHSMDIYVIPNIGNKPIQEITITDLRTVLDVYALMGNTSDWYIIAKVRSLFDYAIEKGYISENYANQLRSDNHPAATKLVLSDKEIKDFFTLCDETDTMYSCLFAVALCTGLRIREAMAISSSQIDYDLKTVKIQSMIKDGKLVSAVKTRRGRKIKLSQTAVAYIDRATELGRMFDMNNNNYSNEYGLIFTTDDGRPLSYTNVNRKLDEIALKLRRPDLTSHTFRHTYMTMSARCGENIKEIQNEVGHGFASDVITEYLHQTDESRHESAMRRQEYLEAIMERYKTEDRHECT